MVFQYNYALLTIYCKVACRSRGRIAYIQLHIIIYNITTYIILHYHIKLLLSQVAQLRARSVLGIVPFCKLQLVAAFSHNNSNAQDGLEPRSAISDGICVFVYQLVHYFMCTHVYIYDLQP